MVHVNTHAMILYIHVALPPFGGFGGASMRTITALSIRPAMISAHTVAASPSVTVNIVSIKRIVSSVHRYDKIIDY